MGVDEYLKAGKPEPKKVPIKEKVGGFFKNHGPTILSLLVTSAIFYGGYKWLTKPEEKPAAKVEKQIEKQPPTKTVYKTKWRTKWKTKYVTKWKTKYRDRVKWKTKEVQVPGPERVVYRQGPERIVYKYIKDPRFDTYKAALDATYRRREKLMRDFYEKPLAPGTKRSLTFETNCPKMANAVQKINY